MAKRVQATHVSGSVLMKTKIPFSNVNNVLILQTRIGSSTSNIEPGTWNSISERLYLLDDHRGDNCGYGSRVLTQALWAVTQGHGPMTRVTKFSPTPGHPSPFLYFLPDWTLLSAASLCPARGVDCTSSLCIMCPFRRLLSWCISYGLLIFAGRQPPCLYQNREGPA